MQQWWHLFTTNLRWFIGSLLILGILIMFMWRLIDPAGFVISINAFLRDVWEIAKFLLVIVIMIAGIAVMFGWRPFRRNNRGGHH